MVDSVWLFITVIVAMCLWVGIFFKGYVEGLQEADEQHARQIALLTKQHEEEVERIRSECKQHIEVMVLRLCQHNHARYKAGFHEGYLKGQAERRALPEGTIPIKMDELERLIREGKAASPSPFPTYPKGRIALVNDGRAVAMDGVVKEVVEHKETALARAVREARGGEAPVPRQGFA